MTERRAYGVIHVKDIYLWSHVGVFEQERLLGQPFLCNFSIWIDVNEASSEDDLSKTADYSLAIREIQQLAFQLDCQTIESFSEHILNCLEALYGLVPMKVSLWKCAPPVPGFNGMVGIERTRYEPPITS